jgi:hypothetical protein
MADIVYTTTTLPPAYIGCAYQAAVAYKAAATPVTAQSVVAGTVLNGLPDGLALDTVGAAPGSLRISGTPTGLASAGNTPKSGTGPYTFTVSATDTAGAVVSATLTINLEPGGMKPWDTMSLTDQLKVQWPTEF